MAYDELRRDPSQLLAGLIEHTKDAWWDLIVHPTYWEMPWGRVGALPCRASYEKRRFHTSYILHSKQPVIRLLVVGYLDLPNWR